MALSKAFKVRLQSSPCEELRTMGTQQSLGVRAVLVYDITNRNARGPNHALVDISCAPLLHAGGGETG
jgi:hypothetical protein